MLHLPARTVYVVDRTHNCEEALRLLRFIGENHFHEAIVLSSRECPIGVILDRIAGTIEILLRPADGSNTGRWMRRSSRSSPCFESEMVVDLAAALAGITPGTQGIWWSSWPESAAKARCCGPFQNVSMAQLAASH